MNNRHIGPVVRVISSMGTQLVPGPLEIDNKYIPWLQYSLY